MPKKILLLADAPGWAFDRRARAIARYAPPGWDVRIDYHGGRTTAEIAYDLVDLVFVFDPKQAKPIRQLFTAAGIKIPLVSTHNSGVGRPGYSLDETLCAADYVVVNNYAAWQAGRYGQRGYRACNISNGVDLSVFNPRTPWGDRPNRALWMASTGKADDHDDVKGYRAILQPLSRVLPARLGIECDFRAVEPAAALNETEMAEWYNSGRYLVCASKSEGTPNIALEAAACGCAVVTTPVGNIPELIVGGRNGVVVSRRDTVGFLDAFEFTAAEQFAAMAEKISGSIQSWDWAKRAPYYYALFLALITGGTPRPFTYLSTAPEQIGGPRGD